MFLTAASEYYNKYKQHYHSQKKGFFITKPVSLKDLVIVSYPILVLSNKVLSLSSKHKALPTKERKEKPIFDYQKIMYDTFLIQSINNPLNHDFKHKHLWVKKATGLGVTEFFLRLMACL